MRKKEKSGTRNTVPFYQFPYNIVQNQPGSDLFLALAKRIRSGSKPVCKNHPARFWPMLPRWSGSDANRIRHVYWESIHAQTANINFQRLSLFSIAAVKRAHKARICWYRQSFCIIYRYQIRERCLKKDPPPPPDFSPPTEIMTNTTAIIYGSGYRQPFRLIYR